MLQLTPQSRLSWKFDIAQNGGTIGFLDLARVRWAGTFSLDGRNFEFKREGFLGPIALRSDQRVIARARRSSLRVKYSISADDRRLELIAVGFLQRSAKIVHGDVVIATIRRPKYLKRAVTIETQQNAPLPLLVFAATVIVLYWRTASRGSS